MRLALPSALAFTLLLTGCGADQPAEGSAATPASTEASSSAAATDYCESLIGAEGAGPVLDAYRWSWNFTYPGYDEAALMDEADQITDDLVEAADGGQGEVSQLARTVFDSLSDYIESGGDRSEVDSTALNDATVELFTACDEYLPSNSLPEPPEAGSETSEPAAAADATFESEFLAAGIKVPPVDDSTPEEYGAYAAESLCRPGMTETSQNFRQLVEIWTGGSIPEEEAKTVGKGEDFTRLVIKYHCPDRMDGLDALIGSAD